MKIYILIIRLSLIGFCLSLLVYLISLFGCKIPFSSYVFGILSFGIFIVWIPSFFIIIKQTISFRSINIWKSAFLGCPEWMKKILYIILAYAFINFIIFKIYVPGGNYYEIGNYTPPAIFIGHSGQWMVFYYTSFAVCYSALNVKGWISK
jgi:hypothetical protein